ncbi:MAG: ferritin-like domain-containing protein [Proteobacteria bacterium]|nr:ferritin-like domain-containing protein [Pseudomonadota bacterium]
MHSFELYHNYEKHEWTLKDIPWDQIDRDVVKPEYIKLARSAVMGECNSVAALHGFLNESSDDYDFAAYASIWGYQEIKHHYAFRTWLSHISEDTGVDDTRVEATREAYPPGITVASTLATNIISELTVCHVYSRLALHVNEPVLKKILSLASQDESRHAREFTYYARRRIERYPAELPSVLETLYVYVSDPEHPVKHPVSVFKGQMLEKDGGETIDDSFTYFMQVDGSNLERLRTIIMNRFSQLTGYKLERPAQIRRALIDAADRIDSSRASALSAPN